MEGSGESLQLSVGHGVEVADGREELDVRVGQEVWSASPALVHGFEFFFVVLQEGGV